MKVLAICATCGRNTCLRRSVGMFLQQDYEDCTLLIHNNSVKSLKLDKEYPEIRLVNCSESPNGKYESLGDIYDDSFRIIEELNLSPDIVCFWDDDDLFLQDHISEGVKGYLRGGKLAYKPQRSWFRHPDGLELINNTLEPSIFVSYPHLKEYGFSKETTAQHLKWVNPLVERDNIFVDPNGKATLIYNWGDRDIPTFKTSGDPNNPNNFSNYRQFSRDHGDGLIIPYTIHQLQPFYNLVSL